MINLNTHAQTKEASRIGPKASWQRDTTKEERKSVIETILAGEGLAQLRQALVAEYWLSVL